MARTDRAVHHLSVYDHHEDADWPSGDVRQMISLWLSRDSGTIVRLITTLMSDTYIYIIYWVIIICVRFDLRFHMSAPNHIYTHNTQRTLELIVLYTSNAYMPSAITLYIDQKCLHSTCCTPWVWVRWSLCVLVGSSSMEWIAVSPVVVLSMHSNIT